MVEKGEFATPRIEQVEAVAHGEDQAAALAQPEAPDRLRDPPCGVRAACRLPAMDGGLKDVDPVERVLGRRPGRRLAERVADVERAGDGEVQSLRALLIV